jgi:hypothetical protein
LCPKTPGVFLLEAEIRTKRVVRMVAQVAVLAKVLFTNSFQAVCRKANKSENQVRPSEFPKH